MDYPADNTIVGIDHPFKNQPYCFGTEFKIDIKKSRKVFNMANTNETGFLLNYSMICK